MYWLKQHRDLIIQLAIVGCLTALLYFSFFRELIHSWMNDEDYSHGFLILPISLYLVWRMRAKLLAEERRPHYGMGSLLLLVWGILYFIGDVGHIYTLTAASFMFFLFGLAIFLAGFSITHHLIFPIAFLVFMMPVPSEIYTRMTNPMMLTVTTISTFILQMISVPVLQDGNLISLPNYSMRVIQACSGVRSLISVSALALLIGYITFPSNIKRLALLFFAIPVAFVNNVVRVVVTALLAFHVSPVYAEGFSHSFAGFMTFALSLAMISLGVVFLQWISPTQD